MGGPGAGTEEQIFRKTASNFPGPPPAITFNGGRKYRGHTGAGEFNFRRDLLNLFNLRLAYPAKQNSNVEREPPFYEIPP